MSLFSKLFGGSSGSKPEVQSVDYNGFKITPTPMPEGARFRLSAQIEKGEQSHTLVRADVLDSHDAAAEAAVNKAKQVIDEQGERLFS
ncbi:HlyU family transcriptional regulator [uncultured Litoreibacter sp.]|uniref:HlyU family transcriptional regulator n=1 Tax=uncultured Litoreibacter sp. TaxID=1392394 RepID=UPI0026371B10|nr:HlyU family transcriptional regulator [uncultured Litoreibacter sp.]